MAWSPLPLRSVGAKKLRTVEMDHVVWRIGNPHLSFPCDFTSVAAERPGIQERGYIDSLCRTSFEQGFDFAMTFGRDGAVGGNCFDQEEPISLGPMKNDVG